MSCMMYEEQAIAGLTAAPSSVDVAFSKSVPANGGEYSVVTPSIPAGKSIISASVIFSSVNHFIWYDLANAGGEWRIYLHNTYSGAQTISGNVRFAVI